MITLGRTETLGYLVLQQALWFLVVWGAGSGHLWWPGALTLALCAAACWRAGPAWWRVAAVVGVGAACALAVDGSLNKIARVGYAGIAPGVPLPPLWIVALWALFAATLALPARRLLQSPLIAGILGGIGGPLAYAGGRALGAIDAQTTGLVLVGVFFALATPVIVLAANRLLPVPAAAPRPLPASRARPA